MAERPHYKALWEQECRNSSDLRNRVNLLEQDLQWEAEARKQRDSQIKDLQQQLNKECKKSAVAAHSNFDLTRHGNEFLNCFKEYLERFQYQSSGWAGMAAAPSDDFDGLMKRADKFAQALEEWKTQKW